MKALVLALDGAERSLLQRWMDSGDLPVLRRLRDEGFSCPIETLPGIGDDGVWQTIATGRVMGGKGIFFFMVPHPGFYDSAFIDRALSPEDAVPTRLAKAGVQVAAIGFPKLVAEPHPNLAHLTNWGVHGPYGLPEHLIVNPRSDAMAAYAGPDPHGHCERTFRPETGTEVMAYRDHLLALIRRTEAAIVETVDRFDPDLMLAGHAAAHCAGHHLWHLHDPAFPAHDPAALEALGEDPLMTIYRALDESVGRMLARFPADVPKLVFAPLGMGPNHTGNHLIDAFLERRDRARDGLGGRLRQLRRRAAYVIADRVPQRPNPFMAHQVALTRRFRDRYTYTRFHNDVSATIWINLEGRDPAGRVSPADFERESASLTEDLLALRDTATGEEVVDAVIDPRDYDGKAPPGALPDLLVLWRRERVIEGLVSPKWGRFEGDAPVRPHGNHVPHGLLLASGPDIAPGCGRPCQLADLTATFVALCGHALPDCDGSPIPGIAAAVGVA